MKGKWGRMERSETSSREALNRKERAWRIGRPVLILAISLVIVFAIASFGYQYVMNHFIRPVDASDTTPVTVEIKRGSSTSAIADALYQSELIRNKAVFKIYVDFTGQGGKLRSGTYVFTRDMEIEDIVDILIKGDGKVQESIKFTLTEGMTVEAMAQSLVDQGVLSSGSRFVELCKSATNFRTSNELIAAIPEEAIENGRRIAMEGYLFPDTYEVYVGSTEETIINRMITRFYGIITEEYLLRAAEMDMTIDEVVILASLIEKEAKTADFKKVSAVFHNRLNSDMMLQSDAAIKYMLGSNKLVFSSEELKTDSPYNTHLYKGLPVGPICNPGKAAIEAALWPDETMIQDKYLYFCLKEPNSGELVFARTLEEHNQNVAQYRTLWEQADAASGTAVNP